MKRLDLVLAVCIILLLAVVSMNYYPVKLFSQVDSVSEIRDNARSSSVQPVLHIPAIRVSFSDLLPEKEILTKESIDKLLEKKVKEIEEKIEIAITEEREKSSEDRYNRYLTELDIWYRPIAPNIIPLGSLVQGDVKWLERVIVVYEIEDSKVFSYGSTFEKDILSISEVANVSISKAREIVSRLNTEGYTVSRSSIVLEKNIKLMWFQDGWTDKYPKVLDWSVEIEGSTENIIRGYDTRGLLEVAPIPKEGNLFRRVHVRAGFRDLKDKFKPKSPESKLMTSKIETLEKELKKTKEELETATSKTKKEDRKRNITEVTLMDVMFGRVKIELFWGMGTGTGIYVGNMKLKEESTGRDYRSIGFQEHSFENNIKSVVLTNEHVVASIFSSEVYVSDDLEELWIIYPAIPYIRYTSTSDHFGSPATILSVDGDLVMSKDFDIAVMVTTPVATDSLHKAVLGNSDNVKSGDRVMMVGNPSFLQKFTTEGVVANTEFSILDTLVSDMYFKHLYNKSQYNWLRNSSFWFDATIGSAGTSGSGVWSLEGKEKGKIIAVHNMGLAKPVSWIAKYSGTEVDIKSIIQESSVLRTETLKEVLVNKSLDLFKNFKHTEAKYSSTYADFVKEYPLFEAATGGTYVSIPGLNGGVPVNKIKKFLEERGIDIRKFGWEPSDKKAWIK